MGSDEGLFSEDVTRRTDVAPEPGRSFGGEGIVASGSVGEDAASAVLSMPESRRRDVLERLLPFLLMPEPVVEGIPWYFLPKEVGVPDEDTLNQIAIAGKLVYAQVRWLDDIADASVPSGPSVHLHRLNEALTRLYRSRFAAVFEDPATEASFFSSLSHLHARYAASLALDGASSPGSFATSLDLDGYVEHAKARAAPLRAPLDALLLLVGVPKEQMLVARRCLECCAAGLQLYDDALDVEEDFKDGRVSWAVAETLRSLGEGKAGTVLDANEFYEAALVGGALDRTLAAAEAMFLEALSLAEPVFPNCVAYLRHRLQETRGLKGDLRRLVESAC